MARQARVIVASTRAAAGGYVDRVGPVIVEWLRARGFEAPDARVVPDGQPVGEELSRSLAEQVDVVLTSGGTGISPQDHTPDVTAALIDYPLPGLAEALRRAGLPQVPTAVLSRGLAGVSGRTLVVNLPGSRGGVHDGLSVLAEVLDHALDQLAGGDHPLPSSGPSPHPQPQSEVSGPAVSEVAPAVVHAEVTEAEVSTDELAGLVARAAAGAVVTFSGVVRNHDEGREVSELEYVGHPSASEVIAEVARTVAARADGVHGIALVHRIGQLGIGEVALACAVAAEHRREAFEVCSDLVDEVKAKLPVWKRQVYADGTESWVGCP